jgi:hypothetical protein
MWMSKSPSAAERILENIVMLADIMKTSAAVPDVPYLELAKAIRVSRRPVEREWYWEKQREVQPRAAGPFA